MKRVSAMAMMIALFATQAAWGQGMVWKVSAGDNILYLGGTIHVLSPSDYPLPDTYDRVYEQADIVVLETDLRQLQDPGALGPLMAQLMYTDGRTLKQVLAPATYDRLSGFTDQRGMPLELLKTMKPGLVMTTLTMAELQRLGLTGAGVDQHFSDRANKDGLPLESLETVAEQIAFIANMGDGQEDEFISYSLDQMTSLSTMMDALKSAWRKGDAQALNELVLNELESEFPETYHVLIASRNLKWRDQVGAFLQTAETELVLVGAAHLVGELGLPSLLLDQGYQVEREY